MNISSKAEYGIRAMTEIAGVKRPITRGVISERQAIPVPFLTQVLRALVTSGLVKSNRGPDGGYVLARPASTISLLDIVTSLQGPIIPKGCLRPNEPELCLIGGETCSLRDVWSELKRVNETVLAGVRLSDLIARQGGQK